MAMNLIEGLINELIPTTGFHLKNIHTDEVFEGSICLAKSLTKEDFVEITEEEYQAIINSSEEFSDDEEITGEEFMAMVEEVL
jgi:hypothetical protein